MGQYFLRGHRHHATSQSPDRGPTVEAPFQMVGRNTADDFVRGHVTGDDGSCRHDRAISHRDTAEDDDFTRHPHVIADDDRSIRRAGVLLILEFDAAQPRDTIRPACPKRNVVTRSVAWMPPGITCTVSLIEQYRPILTGGSC